MSELNGTTRNLKPLLTPEQVIEILQLGADGCSPETARERLRNMCRARKIPYVKLGRLIRFKATEIEEWIEQNTVAAVKKR